MKEAFTTEGSQFPIEFQPPLTLMLADRQYSLIGQSEDPKDHETIYSYRRQPDIGDKPQDITLDALSIQKLTEIRDELSQID